MWSCAVGMLTIRCCGFRVLSRPAWRMSSGQLPEFVTLPAVRFDGTAAGQREQVKQSLLKKRVWSLGVQVLRVEGGSGSAV